jgi:aryl-alcohol dehydrogenase-like predicted oxidoreductase
MATPDDLSHDRAHEAIRVLQEAKEAGKVRFIGVALRHGFDHEPGFPTAYGYNGITEFMEWGVFDMFQIVYGAMFRTSENAITRAGELGHAIKARAIQKDYNGDAFERFAQAGLDELLDGGDRRSFLIRFAISHPAVSTALVGTSNPDHLRANVGAAERGPLPSDIYTEAKRRLASDPFAPKEV